MKKRLFMASISLLYSTLAFGGLQVGYFQKENKDRFTQKIKPVFDASKTCKDCELVDLTPYKEDGTYDEKGMQEQLEKVSDQYPLLFFDWNEKKNDKNRVLSDLMNKKVAQGSVMLFSAGTPTASEPTVALNQTVAGQVAEAIIIGEMLERERLLPHLFYGPEMLTAIKPPREYLGQGLGPVFFASRWASAWGKKKPQEWVSYLKIKKAKNKRMWMDLEDFFPR